MSTPTGLLKIGDFARVAQTNLRTLRYYEELGLLKPAARSEGGFRYYRPTDVNRVQLIWDLQELGLHLDQISKLLEKKDKPQPRAELLGRVRKALTEHDRLIGERIRSLEDQRARVSEALAMLDGCESCGKLPSPQNNHCEPCSETRRSLPKLLSALF